MTQDEQARRDAIERVTQHLRHNYHKPTSVADMAAIAGYSPFYFSRIFTQHIKMAPAQYLAQMRVDAAQTMLAAGHSVADTATAVGYADTGTFAGQFTRRTGQTPSAYRKQHHPGGQQ